MADMPWQTRLDKFLRGMHREEGVDAVVVIVAHHSVDYTVDYLTHQDFARTMCVQAALTLQANEDDGDEAEPVEIEDTDEDD